MIRFGHLIIYQNTSTKICRQCEGEIPKYEFYVKLTGKTKNNKFISTPFHKDCLIAKIEERIQENIDNPKIPGKHTSIHPIHTKLDEDQRKRRSTVMMMIRANDIPRLLEAYQKQSTRRVLRAYELIATRWAELHAFGIPFRTTLIAREPKYWKPKDKALFDALMKWDNRWVDHLASADSPEKKIELMMTRAARGDLPTFPEDDRMEVQERGASHDGQDDSPGSRVPDVPDDAGLPDVQHRVMSVLISKD